MQRWLHSFIPLPLATPEQAVRLRSWLRGKVEKTFGGSSAELKTCVVKLYRLRGWRTYVHQELAARLGNSYVSEGNTYYEYESEFLKLRPFWTDEDYVRS